MNKFILCAMDKRKTKAELLANSCASYAVARAAAAYAAAYSDYLANAAYSAYVAASSAAHALANLENQLTEYFELTGEDREAYQKEADK